MSRFPLLGSCLLLLFMIVVVQDVNGRREWQKPRRKREWVVPPPLLMEHKDYTKRAFIAKVRSDKEQPTERLLYYLHGHGADQPPINLFVVNQTSGFVRITDILDREVMQNYTLYASVRFARNMTLAEDHLTMSIRVTDINDQAPIFQESGLPTGSVYESSSKGTVATQVSATDADEPGTTNADLRYEIIKQEPESKPRMFDIEPKTGEIKVNRPTLDREMQNTYALTVKATDLGGAASGRTGTGTVSIKILDINDNRPVLTNATYSGQIQENAVGVEVMRFKATDADEVDTDNWRAKFQILSGNEDGIFSMETDHETNEGVLTVTKPVDYETMKEINLEVAVDNEAEYEFGKGAGRGKRRKKYPVNIKVQNMPDGPRFVPNTKTISVSEDKDKITVPMLLTDYAAVDEDSGEIAKNVRYAKIYDPAGWIAVDSETGQIKLTRVPDRESRNVVDGVYYAKVLCMTDDLPSKSVTGTIAIAVEDVNDHCPQLTTSYQDLCLEDTAVYVTAHDEDGLINSLPLTFQLLSEGTTGSWNMARFNDTTVVLTAKDFLQPGTHKVAFEVRDSLGYACTEPEVLELTACLCAGDRACVREDPRMSPDVGVKSGHGSFAGPAIGILVGALLLLLLVPLLLLACSSGSGLLAKKFVSLPFETSNGHLIPSHTEGKGEDKEGARDTKKEKE
ncbi:desmoglein-2.1-like [Conger conger]|uniref:desmoglein-2.1-like n=1 Tax=Conger conger TaxID=82655 RepID=UPI002A59D8AA|nr:desmoglein-2.1-like [Conger conger]